MKKRLTVVLLLILAATALFACDALNLNYDPDAHKTLVTLDYQGGAGGVESVRIAYDTFFTLPVPDAEDRIFSGWYTEMGGGGSRLTDNEGKSTELWNIHENITLYAYWGGTEGLYYSYNYDMDAYAVSGYHGDSTSIVIPEYYQGKKVVEIASYTFSGYVGITSVTIPSTVTVIGIMAFSSCSSMTGITLPESLIKIG